MPRSSQFASLIGTAILMVVGITPLAAAGPATVLADDAQVGRFSGVLATTERGVVRTIDAHGAADAAGEIANGIRVAYPLASITKVLTATTIMRLVEEDQIVLTATVEAYLPEYAGRPFAQVTIAQLLSHTSGVPSLLKEDQGLGDGPMDFDALALPTNTKALIDQFSSAPLLFEPGLRYSYSNSGYILLGRIIEVVTGAPYYDALDALVLAPAGVSDAFCLCRDVPGFPNATAFERRGDRVSPAPMIDPSQTFSAAGIRATPNGLLQWSEALMSGRILAPETLELMWRPVAETRNPGESFALGWIVREVDGVRQVAHDGTMPGVVSYLVLIPAQDRAAFGELNVALDLDHMTDSEAYLKQIVGSVVSREALATVPALAPSSAASMLEGKYVLPEGRAFTLQIDEESGLWLETDGNWSVLQLPKLVRAEGPMAEEAENAIAGWATNGEAGLSAYFSPDMIANVPSGAMDDTWRQLLGQFGAYRSHHAYSVTDSFAEVRLIFQRGSLDIKIVYDAEGRINGLQPVGQETEMPATRVRVWVTQDRDLWIDGFAHAGPDVTAAVGSNGGLTFQSGQKATLEPSD